MIWIILIILAAIYLAIAVRTFISMMAQAGFDAAHGIEGPGPVACFVISAFWLVLMPVGFLWRKHEDRRDSKEK